MSSLIAVPKSADRAELNLFKEIFKKDSYNEMGLVYAQGGQLLRAVGFNSVAGMLNFGMDNQYDGAIFYVNDTKRKYPQAHQSPLIVSDKYAFASCGNMLQLTQAHDGQSDAEVFANQVLRPCAQDAPDIMGLPQFNWLVSSIARKYVGVAFLRNDGHLNIIHKDVFNKTDGGIYHVEFEKAKTASYRAPFISNK